MDTTRLYPMPAPEHDNRFTYGLLAEMVTVLECHGYARPTNGGDLVALQEALFGFLYAPSGDSGTVDQPLTDVGGYLSCGCHGSQRDHTCIPFH